LIHEAEDVEQNGRVRNKGRDGGIVDIGEGIVGGGLENQGFVLGTRGLGDGTGSNFLDRKTVGLGLGGGGVGGDFGSFFSGEVAASGQRGEVSGGSVGLGDDSGDDFFVVGHSR